MTFFNMWLLSGMIGSLLLVKLTRRWANYFDEFNYVNDPLGIWLLLLFSISLGPITLYNSIVVELGFYFKFKGDPDMEYKYMIENEED